jgi:diguanylate cyclase (GGDEF)-like protein
MEIPSMKRTTALVMLIFCLSVAAAAAGDPIDELRQKLARDPGPGRAAIARELVEALTTRGDDEKIKENFGAALSTYREALTLLEKYNAGPAAPFLLNHTGLTLLVIGEYQEALDFLLRAAAASERTGDMECSSSSAYLIGYVHRDLANYDLALQYFRKAYETSVALGNQRRVIMALNEIGNVHYYRKQFAESLPYKEKSLKLARKFGDPELLANSLHDMGEFYHTLEQPGKALPMLQEALALYRRAGLARGTIITLTTIADLQLKLGNFDSGLSCLHEAWPLAEKTQQNRDLANILLLFSQIHEKMQDHRKSLEYHRRYHDLWARLFNEDKNKQIAEMQARYEVEKKQRENELLKQEKEIGALALDKERNQRNFLFYLALLVMILAALIYSRFRIKARANRKLEAANNQIVAQQGKLEEAYRSMEDLARHDQLTGLPNRRVALEEIDREEKRFQRSQNPFSLIMTDIDGFKVVNDTVGHDAGDYVLRSVAALFSQSLRAQDMVYRWGGDEFLFLLPETGMDGALVFMAAVKEKIRASDFIFNGQRLQVAASMGAGVFASGLTVESCLRSADQEMYRSRQR